MQLNYWKITRLKLLFLMAGPGLYASQLLSRFAVSSIYARQALDIIFIVIIFYFGVLFFKIPKTNFTKFILIFSVFAFFFNIFSLMNGYTSIDKVLYSSICFIFLPAFLSIIVSNKNDKSVIEGYINYFLLPLLILNFLVAFLELSLRGASSFGALQITGRSYELIGLSIFGLILASRYSFADKIFLYLGYFITVAMSFSRGAILVFTLIFLQNSLKSFKQLFKWLSFFIFISMLIIWSGLTLDLINLNFFNIFEFWGKRLDIGVDQTVLSSVTDGSSGRISIYLKCLDGLSENPFLGVGIAQTQSYFIENYNNLAYSGCHNLFITPLLERGVLGALVCWSIIIIAIYRVARISLLYIQLTPIFLMGMLILFGATTGVELIIMSDSVRNANILFSFFLIISIFRVRKEPC